MLCISVQMYSHIIETLQYWLCVCKTVIKCNSILIETSPLCLCVSIYLHPGGAVMVTQSLSLASLLLVAMLCLLAL